MLLEKKKEKHKVNNICACGKIINKKSKQCTDCYHNNSRLVERPSHKELQNDINMLGYRNAGKKYNVSDNTIRKWIKQYNIRM